MMRNCAGVSRHKILVSSFVKLAEGEVNKLCHLYHGHFNPLQASNRDDSRAGWRAMDAFVDTVADALIQNPAKERKQEEVPAPLAFLVEQFKAILLSTNSSSKSMGLAIQGYGKLAPALVRHYPVSELVRMVGEVLYRAEQVYLQAGKKEESWILQLPGHVLACAGLISSLPCPSPTTLGTLERLAVLLLDRFPQLPSQYHFRFSSDTLFL